MKEPLTSTVSYPALAASLVLLFLQQLSLGVFFKHWYYVKKFTNKEMAVWRFHEILIHMLLLCVRCDYTLNKHFQCKGLAFVRV